MSALRLHGPGSLDVLRLLGLRFWALSFVLAGGVAVVIGVPTDVLPNPWFTRMTPVRGLDYVFWPATSVLVGMLLASYVLPGVRAARAGRRVGLGSGALGWLAIGCPICNKLIVALLGVSGALNYFGPLQPWLGSLGVLLAGAALAARLRTFSHGCRTRPADTQVAARSTQVGLP